MTLRDGAQIYWEASGNPDGIPAVYLHGGPGSGLGNGGYRRRFDPRKYRIIGLDQRGCGRSRPWAVDSLKALDSHTTQALIEDLEELRIALDVTGWLVHGVSWGSTLALAYALENPDHVTALVLTAVTSGSREEVSWLTEGMGAIFPEEWESFSARRREGQRVVETYAEQLRSPDPSIRANAAEAWERWEMTHVSLGSPRLPGSMFTTNRERENFALLVTHFWANDCFLTGTERVLERASELAPLPGILIHGRRDVSAPAMTAWALHKAWPSSTLHIVEDEGHGGPRQRDLTTQAMETLAHTLRAD